MAWYRVVDSADLEQGDILLSCPIVNVLGFYTESDDQDDIDEREVEYTERHLIVLSQSCDLQHNKVSSVLLAEVKPYSAIKDELGNSKQARRFREALVRGNIVNASLLHEHTPEPPLEWSIVDFHDLHVLPKSYILQFVERCGQRLRLEPPYREHLSQALARYFMRVGLPHSAKAFEEYTGRPDASAAPAPEL